MRMLPLAMYLGIVILCQAVTVVIAVATEQLGFKWGSVIVFGVFYFVMFVVAWKITVLIVDGVLVKKGYVKG